MWQLLADCLLCVTRVRRACYMSIQQNLRKRRAGAALRVWQTRLANASGKRFEKR